MPILNNLRAIKHALEQADIEFIDDGQRWGVAWLDEAGERQSVTLPYA